MPAFVPNTSISDWILKGIMPLGTWQKIGRYAQSLRTGMANCSIDTAMRQAQCLA